MIKVNPQWTAEWVQARTDRDDSRAFLARCRGLTQPMWETPHRFYHYWDENGDLCVETWENDHAKIHGYIKSLVDCGVCDENGRRTGEKPIDSWHGQMNYALCHIRSEADALRRAHEIGAEREVKDAIFRRLSRAMSFAQDIIKSYSSI